MAQQLYHRIFLAFHQSRTCFSERGGWVETSTDRFFFRMQCAVRETILHMFLMFQYLHVSFIKWEQLRLQRACAIVDYRQSIICLRIHR